MKERGQARLPNHEITRLPNPEITRLPNHEMISVAVVILCPAWRNFGPYVILTGF